MTPADPPSGRALSDEQIAEIRAAHEGCIASGDDLCDVPRLLAHIDALTADLDAARESLAALRDEAGKAVVALMLAQEYAGKPDPSYMVLDVTRNTREDLERALADARPDEPTTEGGAG